MSELCFDSLEIAAQQAGIARAMVINYEQVGNTDRSAVWAADAQVWEARVDAIVAGEPLKTQAKNQASALSHAAFCGTFVDSMSIS